MSAIGGTEVAVLGGTLATFRLGPRSERTPLVLAVHGITASSQAWLAVARALAGQASLLAPDIRGRGRSNALPAPYGIAAHARDMLAVLDHFRCERTVLLGHSLGAYIVARLAADHPERVAATVLVDGGLTIPGIEGVDPQQFVDAFLGPAMARLQLTFPTPESYHEWWRKHPAIAGSDVADADLVAYADHDLSGEEPNLHSAVAEASVRGDAADLLEMGKAAHRLTVPAKLLCAPRGLVNDPNPMQPLPVANAWAAEAPGERQVIAVPDVNHYTLVMGAAGARAVADEVAETLRDGS